MSQEHAPADMASRLDPLPRHVAIIMDGNGRWAKVRGKARSAGHQEGVVTVKKIVSEAARLGIPYLSLYTFSTENWKRAAQEVGFLMDLLVKYIKKEYDFYRENGIRIVHSGDVEGLPPAVRQQLEDAVRDTADNGHLVVNLAINYGGRNELVRAARRLIDAGTTSCCVDEDSLGKALDNPELPDVDFLIRTGGEQRISNFLLWKAAYAELFFDSCLWPDFSVERFHQALEEYTTRQRRFGGT